MLILSALFLYTLKKMSNINIQSGRGLILTGNRQKAGTYVGIAKRKMHDMKQMMRLGNLQYMKKVYPVERDCVYIHLTSIDGADFTKIHACTEGGFDCQLDLEDFERCIIPCAEFSMQCFDGNNPKGDEKRRVSFMSMTADRGNDWDQYDWDFGDGEVELDGGAAVSHVYEESGEYTITLTVSKFGINVNLAATAIAGGSSGFGVSRKDPPPDGASAANAYARFLASLTSGAVSSNRYQINCEMGNFNIPSYTYTGSTSRWSTDLTAVDPSATVTVDVGLLSINTQVFHWPTNGVLSPIVMTEGVKCDVGGSVIPGNSGVGIADLTGSIGGVAEFGFTDINDFGSPLPDVMPDVAWPVTWGNVVGYLMSEPVVRVRTVDSSLSSSQTISVYAGNPIKKTKLVI